LLSLHPLELRGALDFPLLGVSFELLAVALPVIVVDAAERLADT
jgi:hypothetical protein